MSPQAKYRRTFFFLEGIALLVLFQFLWTDINLATLLPIFLMIVGYKFDVIRILSWFVIFFFSLFLIFLYPIEINGYILGLCGVYILFNTSLLRKRLLPASITILAMLVVVQGVGVWYKTPREGFLLPKVVAIDLILAILSVIFRSKWMGIIPREENLPVLKIPRNKYTERESEILKLIWEGKTAKEIAQETSLSDSTTRKMLSRLYPKFEVLGMKELYSLQYSHKIEWS